MVEEKKSYDDLVKEAIEMIEDDDELYCELVEELDNWNGYADGFRCYEMCELDDYFCDCKVSEFLEKITDDFRLQDDYFYFSIYGLESCDDKAELYRDNTTAEEVFDNVLDNSSHLYFYNTDFAELLEMIENYEEDDELEEAEE